jgi:hypothetical protein
MSENRQLPRGELDPEAAAIELWRLTKNDSADRDWEAVTDIRKREYCRIAIAVLREAGCLNGLRKAPSDNSRLLAMQNALLAAAEQFDRYVDYHLAKQPADREKAATNLEWAARCREAAGAGRVWRCPTCGTRWVDAIECAVCATQAR